MRFCSLPLPDVRGRQRPGRLWMRSRLARRQFSDFTVELAKTQRQVVHSAGAEFVPSLFEPWVPDGFGGIFIHSCGNWLHQIPSLAKVRGLRGLEFGASEKPFGPVAEYFAGRAVLACRVGLHRDIKFKNMADFVAAILKSKKTNRGLFINVDITNGLVDDSWPETDLIEIHRLIIG